MAKDCLFPMVSGLTPAPAALLLRVIIVLILGLVIRCANIERKDLNTAS